MVIPIKSARSHIKQARKYFSIFLISFCKNNQETIQWSLFLGHGIMAHIPWPLNQ